MMIGFSNHSLVPTSFEIQKQLWRLGTPAITTRGAKEDLMLEIAEMIETVLSNVDNEEVIAQVRARVNETMKKYPLFAY